MNLPIDPAWFFSSLAQSAASVLGIICAILITRVHAQMEEGRRRRPAFTRSVKVWRTSIVTALSAAKAFAEHGPRQLEEHRALLGELGSVVASLKELYQVNGSVAEARVTLTQVKLKEQEDLLAFNKKFVEVLEAGVRVNGIKALRRFLVVLSNLDPGPVRTHGVDSVVERLKLSGSPVVFSADHLFLAANPYLPLRLLILMPLFMVFGVIIPLGVLAVQPGRLYYLTGGLLVGFLVYGILVASYLLHEIRELQEVANIENFDGAVVEIDFI